jgi:hypothetical protein
MPLKKKLPTWKHIFIIGLHLLQLILAGLQCGVWNHIQKDRKKPELIRQVGGGMNEE